MQVLTVGPEDLRRVAITCRCGLKGIATFPKQLASQINMHFCEACNTAYEITQQNGKWHIRRSPDLNDGQQRVQSHLVNPEEGPVN